MDLSLVSLDSLLGDLPTGNTASMQLAPNLAFRPSGALRFLPSPKALIGRDGLDAEALEQLRSNRQKASRLPTGLFELSDVIVVPPYGLIIDPVQRTSYVGRCIGWSARDFSSAAEQLPGATLTPGALHLADWSRDGFHDLDEALMAAAPHYEGYGHWLLDFLPRLHMAREQQHTGLPVYRDPELGWARQLCHLAGFSRLLPATGTGAAWYRVKRLIVPSVFRVLDEGDPGVLLTAWSMLEQALDRQVQPAAGRADGADLLYVSRRDWSDSRNRRRLVNAERIEEILVGRGFTIIRPEAMSLAQQRDMFRRARVVIGEDGSGLHNTISSPPGTRIGVIAMDRINLVHVATARLRGQSVTFIPTQTVSAEDDYAMLVKLRRLRPAALDKALSRLLNERTTPEEGPE